jgi:SAM-dependent methyltransferase
MLPALAHRLIQGLRRLRPGSGRPVPVAALNAEYASGSWDHFAGSDEAVRYQAVRDVVRRRLHRPRLLDVGCGSGQLARQFESGELAEYLGIDLATEGLRRARALGLPHGQFIEADFETWRPPSPWDVIVFNEVIGYALRPDRTVRAFRRSLAPGGIVVISYYRSGNYPAIWRRLLRGWTVLESVELHGAGDRIWDLRVLAPSSPGS